MPQPEDKIKPGDSLIVIGTARAIQQLIAKEEAFEQH
jgi:K+/H+ antiporter YhaU regulatory subunit KhtT